MDRNEILEKLVDKVKKEGKLYTRPNYGEGSTEYFYTAKSPMSVVYSLITKGHNLILEELPFRNEPTKVFARDMIIARTDECSTMEIVFAKVYTTTFPWAVMDAFRTRDLFCGKSIEDFLTSLC